MSARQGAGTASTSPAGTEAELRELSHGYLDGVRSFCEEDYQAALRRFQAVLLASPRSAAALAACGHCHLHQGNVEKAREFYRRIEEIGASPPDALYNHAVGLLRAGREEEALPLFQRLLSAPPPVQPGSFYLGLFFQSTEELLCDVCLYLGHVHRNREDLAGARKWYEEALRHRPENVTAYQRLAELAILSKNYIESINLLNRVLEISPLEEDRINAHNNLGIACYENGMLEEAIRHLTTVLKHSPANPTAVYNLNFIYQREGVFDQEAPTPRAIRFMDVNEGASPIFELGGAGDGTSAGALAIIGKSQGMLRTMRHARVASAADSPVLIRGENGTGKELLAQLIALNSSRRDAPFTVVNCGSIPELVLESELFGHEKGAFTGARARKLGAIELSEGGTVFLDELTALSPRLQGCLLRALRDRHFTPMGGNREVPVKVRFISATSRDITKLVEEKVFREDLFYELNVIPIEIPPLRDRREDIPLLADYFLHRYGRHEGERRLAFPAEDLQILQEYEWPGNVRELENLVQRAVVMGSQSSLYLEELARLRRTRASGHRRESPSGDAIQYPREITLADLEKRHILAVLEACENNQRHAAKTLGINPSTLWRKLKTYGIGES